MICVDVKGPSCLRICRYFIKKIRYLDLTLLVFRLESCFSTGNSDTKAKKTKSKPFSYPTANNINFCLGSGSNHKPNVLSFVRWNSTSPD